MKLAHRARLDSDFSNRDRGGDCESGRVDDLDRTAVKLSRIDLGEVEDVGVRNLALRIGDDVRAVSRRRCYNSGRYSVVELPPYWLQWKPVRSPLGKMYNCSPGMWSNAEMLVLKFFARTSLGTCASQSVSCAWPKA